MRLRLATERDRSGLVELLCGLSAESAYRRFQTGLGPAPRARVVDSMLPPPESGAAVVAYDGARLVGHGVWRRSGAEPVAEVALVVADDHQASGVGTALAQWIFADLAAHGIEQVEVFATATNEPVARMVARHAPDAIRERDGSTVTYTFPTPAAAAARVA